MLNIIPANLGSKYECPFSVLKRLTTMAKKQAHEPVSEISCRYRSRKWKYAKIGASVKNKYKPVSKYCVEIGASVKNIVQK